MTSEVSGRENNFIPQLICTVKTNRAEISKNNRQGGF